MFSKTSTETERLGVWRDFRKNFSGTEEDVAKAFANTKIQQRFIDYYTPENWPSVFEIVKEGMFCQSGVTLVVAATLHYHEFIKTPEINLNVISNHITGHEGLVLEHSGKHYNFLPGQVIDDQFVQDNSTVFDRHIITVDKLFS